MDLFPRLNPNSGLPLYRQLLREIEQRIVGGRIRSGEKLPSVRELSEQLKLNMLTVNKVYQLLEAEGLVETRRGLGTFVVDRARAGAADRKNRLIRPSVQQLVSEAKNLGISSSQLAELVRKEYGKK